MKMTWMVLVTSLALVVPLLAGTAVSSIVSQDAELKVDLNRAGVEELMQLPGVGKTVAARIVSYREERGGFDAPEELMNVRGIGEKTYLKIETYVTVSKKSQNNTQKKK